jgi:nucleoid DNA-binding protein
VDITAYIRELLFGHDCVIIPEFGAFISNYASARTDTASNTFYPPVKKISFNVNLTHNDGLLIGKISAQSGMNYSDTRNLVEDFVKDVRRKLNNRERVVFINIGVFTSNNEGNIQFEPDAGANYLLDSFGLDSFQFNPLEQYDVRKKIVKYPEPLQRSSARKVLWRAAVIIPILGMLVAVPFSTDIFRTKTQQTNLNPLASIEFENNRQTIDKEKSSDSLLLSNKTIALEEKASIPQPVLSDEPKSQPKETQGKFYLIAGSFKSQVNASVLTKKLENEGYKPEILTGPNGFLRVSVKKCSTLSEAESALGTIEKNYPGTWITRVR